MEGVVGGIGELVEDKTLIEVAIIFIVFFGSIIGFDFKLASLFFAMRVTSSQVSTPLDFACWNNLSCNPIMKYFTTNALSFEDWVSDTMSLSM